MATEAGVSRGMESVSAGLAPFRRRAGWLEVARTILVGALVLLAGLMAAMWIDLMLPISQQGRWALTRVGLLAGIVAILATCWWFVRRLTLERIASWVDAQARTGGETLTGWQLERSPPSRSSRLTRGFAEIAAMRAGQRLAQIEPKRVLSAARVQRAAWLLSAGVLAAACLSLIMPQVAWNQWQRFAFPARDVPPFTGVAIELGSLDATVLYGADLTIEAKVTAGRVEFMELVTVTPDGKEHVTPMLEQRPESWHAILTRLTAPLEIYARSGRSRSRVGRVNVQMTPRIVSANVRITPPAYTKRPRFEGAIPKDGLVGLKGTLVEFTITSNRPLRDGRLQLAFSNGTSESLTLKPANASDLDEDAATVRGQIELKQPGRFDASVFDIDGVESLDRVSGAIEIVNDQRPVVRILEPKPLSVATPDVHLPIVVAAEDDFGLTSLQVYRSLNGSSATPMQCEVTGDPRQNAHTELPLDRYGLSPGDEIRLFARAEDNDPAGAKGAESPVTIVRIISKEELQKMLLRQEGAQSVAAKYQAAARYLENLAEALREAEKAEEAAAANPDSTAAAEELQEKLIAARKEAAESAKRISQLAEQPLPIDVDRELADRLAEMAEELGESAEQLGKMGEAQSGQRPLTSEEKEQLQKMAERVAGGREKLDQQAIKPLERLQQAMPLIVDQQRFVELTAQQRDLAQRLDSLRSSSDANEATVQRRVAELEAEQQQVRASLDALLDEIAAHAEELPDMPELQKLKATAKEFVDAVRESEAQASMAAAQQELLGSNFPGAIDQARTAADILESFLSKCNAMGQGACQSCEMAFNPSAGCPNLGNSIDQMLAMMGMRPGTKSGGGPGMGFGFGAGGGYSVRSPGPSNIGMYGAMPSPTFRQSSQGRGNRQSQGMATNAGSSPDGPSTRDGYGAGEGSAAGQADSSVPPQYRGQVAEYFERLTEQLGDQP